MFVSLTSNFGYKVFKASNIFGYIWRNLRYFGVFCRFFFRVYWYSTTHKEIIQKLQYVADCWGPIVSHLKLYFPDMCCLHELYSSILPTNVKVISLLKATPLTAAEGETLVHLKRFIRGLDESKLATFLRFTTASDVLVTDTLTIFSQTMKVFKDGQLLTHVATR